MSNDRYGAAIPITLTGDVSIAAQDSRWYRVNGVVYFRFKQDSTGYHKVTWDASFQGAERFMPRQGPGQVSTVEFLANGDNTYSLLGFDGIDLTRPMHVRDWGADPSVDCAPAIQACVDYILSLNNGTYSIGEVPAMELGHAIYPIGHPIFLWGSIRLLGDSPTASQIAVQNNSFYYNGPAIVVAGAYTSGNHPPFGASLATGPGASFDMTEAGNPNSKYFIPFHSSDDMYSLNGRSELTVEFFIKPAFTGSEFSRNIIASQGRICIEDSPVGAFYVGLLNTGKGVEATVTLSGSGAIRVGSPDTVLTTNTTSHVAVTYDGSHLRLWVDGVKQDEVSGSGTIVQRHDEDIIIGPQFELWPY